MCFSATASFAAAAVTGAVGVASIKKRKNKKDLLVASIPLLFSIQQLIEGAQWLLDKPSLCSEVFGYGFLLFAFLLWPTYLPLALYLIEPDNRRKKVLFYLSIIGLTVSTSLLIFLFISPISVLEIGHHLVYEVSLPFSFSAVLIYVLATCGSAFISSFRVLRMFGLITFIFWMISVLFYSYAFTSVWCFFAAILSVIVYLHFTKYESKKMI